LTLQLLMWDKPLLRHFLLARVDFQEVMRKFIRE
jgi:hypothetical protein